jgi:hypothetical protein
MQRRVFCPDLKLNIGNGWTGYSPTTLAGWCDLVHRMLFFFTFFNSRFFFPNPCLCLLCVVLKNRCLEKGLDYPPENPILCHYANTLNDTFVIRCCKDRDMCNKDLKPSLHVKNKTGRFLGLAWRCTGHSILASWWKCMHLTQTHCCLYVA